MPASSAPNPLLLAADASPSLLPLLRSKPALAHIRDRSGYTLLHALVSYNHLTLLRQVVDQFDLDVNIRDADGETPLFACETVQAVQCLVQELGADVTIKNDEGKTARERIHDESEFPAVAQWLSKKPRPETDNGDGREAEGSHANHSGDVDAEPLDFTDQPLPVPKGVSIDFFAVDEGAQEQEIDEQFRQRIESLASRPDFESEDSQKELRVLVSDAIRGVELEDRGVRGRLT